MIGFVVVMNGDVDLSGNGVVIVRDESGELVRQEIAQTVTNQSEMEEELRHLFAALRS